MRVILFLCLVLCGSAQALAATSHQPLKIMIDPGHGGIDTGAVSGVAHEAEIALKVALALRRRLLADPRFVVAMTRETDHALTLPQRIQKADQFGADLFLSIHANSSPDPRAKGIEFYLQNQLPADEESLFLAANENKVENIIAASDQVDTDPKKDWDLKAIIEDLNRQHRTKTSLEVSRRLAEVWRPEGHVGLNTVRQAPFYVVTQGKRPAVLVELGFVTHPVEGPLLAKPETQERIAEKIHRGLIGYVDGQGFPRAP